MNLSRVTVLVFLSAFSEIISQTVLAVNLVAEFNNKWASGKVNFSQTATNGVQISVAGLNLQGESNLSLHEFPVKFTGPMSEICKDVGEIIDPKNMMKEPNYNSNCKKNRSVCAIGDISGKLNGKKVINDNNLSISGKESIFGRSLVIRDSSNNLVACAQIRLPSPVKTVVGVFRAISPGIAGTIVLRQSETSPNLVTSVDVDLLMVDARSESKKHLSLMIHEHAFKGDTEGSCADIGEVFNPLRITSCDKRSHSTCPIGELMAKLGPIEVPLPGEGSHRSFFIDTNLPLSGQNSVIGRSLVISENGRALICATIQEFQQIEAEVALGDIKGLSGAIGFRQRSMYDPAVVNYNVSAVGGSVPVGVGASCSEGDNWYNITGSGQLDGLTLYGSRSVIFRSLVVKGTGSSKSVCKTVQPKEPTYRVKVLANFTGTDGNVVTGFISVEQVVFNSSKAFAYLSSIILDVQYRNDKKKMTPNHNWHIHSLPLSGKTSMAISKRCGTTMGHYNPYNVYVKGNEYSSTCNAMSPFRCELGDLSNKLGTYTIGSGMKHLTETENYLASWHNIVGRSLVIHAVNKGAPRIACADLLPQMDSSYSQETLTLKNSSATRDKNSFQNIVSEALGVSSWRVANVKFEGMKGNNECLYYSFLLIDDSSSNLHNQFSVLVNDDAEKLKDFAPACGEDTSSKWEINKGNVGEILGVVFGIIAILILVLCMICYLRKRHQQLEEEAKLVVKVEESTANPGFSTEREKIETEDETPPTEQNDQGKIETEDETPSTAQNDQEKTSDPATEKEWKVTTTL